MANWKSENSLLTKQGEEILNKLNLGQGKITLSRIVVGSGRVSESLLYKQTTISGNLKEMIIDHYNSQEVGTELSFHIDNVDFDENFDINQIGVYVTHPDYTGEILYHISQCDEVGADNLPAYAGNAVSLSYSLYLVHGNSSSIEITIDPLGMVTNKEFTAFREGIKPGKLVTTDSSGNLIASGKSTAIGHPVIVTDAADAKTLSLSIEGNSIQATPTVSAPKFPTPSRVLDIRTYGTKNLFNVRGTMLKTSAGATPYLTPVITDSSLVAYPNTASNYVPYYGCLMHIEVGKQYVISYGALSNNVMTYVELDTYPTYMTSSNYGTAFNSGFTFTATKPYLLVSCHPADLTNGTTPYGFLNVQVEEGSTPTTFVPFKGATISLPSNLSIDLRSVGDYHDTIEWDGSKWWKVQRIAEIKLDGSTNKVSAVDMVNSDTIARSNIVLTSANNLVMDAYRDAPVMCSHGNTVGLDSDFYVYFDKDSGCLKLHTKYTALGLSSGSKTSTERATEINNWLLARKNSDTTNIKLWYVLGTAVVTELSMTSVLDMFKDYTKVETAYEKSTPNIKLGYALNTTDPTTLYILRNLARKSDIQVANTFAIAELVE